MSLFKEAKVHYCDMIRTIFFSFLLCFACCLFSQEDYNQRLFNYSLESACTLALSPFNWGAKDYTKIAAGFSLFTLAYTNDAKLYEFIQSNKGNFSDDLAWLGEKWGNGQFLGGVYAQAGISSLVWPKNTDIKIFFHKGMVSGFYTSATILFLKHLIQRKRPYMAANPYEFGKFWEKPHYHSLPSGHTAAAFNLATLIAHSTEKKVWGVLAYSLATLTAWSRVYDQKHWVSDVVFGGILSTAITKSVLNSYKK